MGNLKLNAEQFHNTYEVLNKAINTDVVAKMGELASLLKPMADDNNLVPQAIENAKKLANDYNEGFYPSLVGLKKSFDELYDVSEFLAKSANIGEVGSVDSSFKSGTIDGSSVMA